MLADTGKMDWTINATTMRRGPIRWGELHRNLYSTGDLANYAVQYPADPPSVQKGMNALLVDDEKGIVTIGTLVLEGVGFQVRLARNGLEGWETFKQRSGWDIAILDRAMPGMNGEELAVKIKADSPDLPLIMITGIPDAVANPLLFHRILAKPFLPSDLLKCVAGALEASPAAVG